jgi:hypothetical protein
MTQDELRKAFLRYTYKPTLDIYQEVLNMIADFMVMSIHIHHSDDLKTEADGHAKLIYQMIMTRVLSINSLSNGVSYHASNGTEMNNIIDPTVIAGIVRNTFETGAMFNLIYVSTKSEEEKKILHSMWVIAGLKYRQRFAAHITLDETRQKQEAEKAEIELLRAEIENTELFKSLDEENQHKVRERIKKKEYLMRFQGKQVQFLAWYQLIELMGMKPGMFSTMYTYLSLYTHPSNVSVFQFGEMFSKEQHFVENTRFNIQYAVHCVAVFLSDFIKIYPTYKKTFEQQSLMFQILINFYNKFLRGDDHVINDTMKYLG